MCNEKASEGQEAVRVVDFVYTLLEGKTPECPKGGKCVAAMSNALLLSVDDVHVLSQALEVAKARIILSRYQSDKGGKGC